MEVQQRIGISQNVWRSLGYQPGCMIYLTEALCFIDYGTCKTHAAKSLQHDIVG